MKGHLRTFVALCFLIGLDACSLQDHVVPKQIKLSTPAFEYTDDFKMRFKVQADSLGDLPVTEYGILYLSFFRAENDTDYTPGSNTVRECNLISRLPWVLTISFTREMLSRGSTSFSTVPMHCFRMDRSRMETLRALHSNDSIYQNPQSK